MINQPLRILIADNRSPIRQGLKALLSQQSQINVVGEAVNGREATLMAASLEPDVVLMDMQMPVMDGLEAVKQIKSQAPQIKIIALTLHSGYRAAALAAGVDTFLLKGCSADCLLDAVLERVPMNVGG